MDAFYPAVKATTASSSSQRKIAPHSAPSVGPQRTERVAKPKPPTPYSRATRLERIRKALDAAASVDPPTSSSPSVTEPPSIEFDKLASTLPPSIKPKLERDAESVDSKAPSLALSRKEIMNMKAASNPILHSTAPARSQHIASCATGHQRGGGSMSTKWLAERDTMLEAQSSKVADTGHPELLKGLRIYVNGYTAGTTRTEITRLVTMHGGTNLRTASSATHVITSMGLSGSKTNKVLNSKVQKRNSRFVVKPEWLYDSLNAGKRLKEYDYRVVTSNVQAEFL